MARRRSRPWPSRATIKPPRPTPRSWPSLKRSRNGADTSEGRPWPGQRRAAKPRALIAPNSTPDGNDRISPDNRRNQNGPEKGVGVRHNGQGLDLNRDGVKLESPEMRGLGGNVRRRWDPALVVDCHTTNGAQHEEPVTYSR